MSTTVYPRDLVHLTEAQHEKLDSMIDTARVVGHEHGCPIIRYASGTRKLVSTTGRLELPTLLRKVRS